MANSAFGHEPSFTIPGSTTDNAVIRWDGTSGGGQLNSGIIIDDSNVITGVTSLTVDNLLINGNTISSTAGTDLLITPLGGQQLILDGTIIIDAGVVTGATSITATEFVGGGVGLTALNGTQITSGTLPDARIGADSIVEGKLNVSNAPTNGQVLTARDGVAGGFTWEAAGGGAVSAVANGSDNRIATFSAATTLNGESALTFNGTTLTIGSDYDLSDANGLYKRTNGTLQLNSNSSMAFNIDSDSNQSGRGFFWYNNSLSQSGTQIAHLEETGVLYLYHTAAGARINIKQTNGAGTSANGHIRIQDENDGQVGYMGKGSSNGTMQFVNESAASVTIATSGITRLTIAANGTLSGSSTNDISDERIKENIENTAIGLAEILQLRPVKFNFMAGKGWGEPGQKFYGFLAQEVEAIIPEAVETTDIDLDEEQGGKKRDVNGVPDLKSVTMTQITTALVKAVQELNAKVDAL